MNRKLVTIDYYIIFFFYFWDIFNNGILNVYRVLIFKDFVSFVHFLICVPSLIGFEINNYLKNLKNLFM